MPWLLDEDQTIERLSLLDVVTTADCGSFQSFTLKLDPTSAAQRATCAPAYAITRDEAFPPRKGHLVEAQSENPLLSMMSCSKVLAMIRPKAAPDGQAAVRIPVTQNGGRKYLPLCVDNFDAIVEGIAKEIRRPSDG